MVSSEALPLLTGYSLFGGEARITFSGRKFGDCRVGPIIDQEPGFLEHLGRLRSIQQFGSVPELVAMRPDFGRRLEMINTDKVITLDPGLVTPTEKCDAIATINRPASSSSIFRRGVFMASADCPVGVLYFRKGGWFVVMHLGLKCLIGQAESLIDTVIGQLLHDGHLKRDELKDLEFFAGFGAGPCCFGYPFGSPTYKQVEAFMPEALSERVSKSCHEGQPGINLIRIIQKIAGRYVLGHKMSFHTICTSCFGARHKDEFGDYYSTCDKGVCRTIIQRKRPAMASW